MSDNDFYRRSTLPGIGDESKGSPPSSIAGIPKFIGKYRIENLLEKGGMSILYLGTHPETREPTTIKVLSPRYLSHPEVVQRFLNEAEIIAMADHPNIVKLYGSGEWEGGLYISMEFIQGTSLRQYILQNPISLKRALEIIIDIAYALCHLHTHGVIHRDLKPENVLMTENDVVKVIDFGIAQLLTERIEIDSEEPYRQRLIGTPIYMSPEQKVNPESVSYPSDIYSLGIIAYELILGKLSHGQIHLALMPKGIQKILTKALQPNPQDRYQDVVDFIADISAYLNSSNLQKEKKVGDHLSELAENFKRAQTILLPEKYPAIPNIDVKIAIHKNINISGIYHEFLELPDNWFGVVMCESSARDAEGFIFMSLLRGMVHTLSKLTNKPTEFATILNEMLLNEHLDHVFTLNFLAFNPRESCIRYISCGFSGLWIIPPGEQAPSKISQDNLALGIDYKAQFTDGEIPWESGMQLILGSVAGLLANPKDEFEINEKEMVNSLTEMHDLPNQKIVEGLLRKMKSTPQPLERTICFIGIRLN